MVYHICRKDDWEKAKIACYYSTPSLKEQGFIHFSTKEQVADVANLLYKGQKDLVLLCVDENKTNSKMIFEDLKGHGTYPHLYGLLRIEEVLKVIPFQPNKDGNFSTTNLL